ncbi:hypothetical protein D3C77_496790 [compost metagenome]
MNGQKLKFMPAEPNKAPEKRRMRNTEKSNMGSALRRCATTKTMKLTIATPRLARLAMAKALEKPGAAP